MKNKIRKLAGVSFETVTQALADALRKAYPTPEGGDPCTVSCAYPCEVYDDKVVYSKDAGYFEEAYTFANGVATLGGSPQPVVRQYVPASGNQNAPAPVTQAAKTEGVMATKTAKAKKTAVAKAGGADIVALAAERLNEMAKTLGKGEGQITPEVAAEIGAVVSLLETAQELYSGGAPTEDDTEVDDEPAPGGGEITDQEMADLAASAKSRNGIVKMSGAQFLAYAVAETKAVKAETDPVKKAVRLAHLEKNLAYASYWTGAAFEGATPPAIPVAVVSDPSGPLLPTEVTVNANTAAPSNFLPAESGGATGVGGNVSQTAAVAGTPSFMEKLAEVTKSIAVVRGDKAPAAIAKNQPETASGLWAASFVDTLPDSAFLYVEPNANKSADGLTTPSFRHFPIRDMKGQLSKQQLAHAIKMIPTFGATPEFKAELLKKAEGMFGLEESIEKSASLAGARGDDGWPADMSDPEYMRGRQPAKSTQVFGFDNIPDKLTALGVTDGEG